MEHPKAEPVEILLENFEKEYYRLSFIVDNNNVHLNKEFDVSVKAGEIIGKLYELILAQYKDAKDPSPATLKSLNMLCVRIVFCLYAEDAGVFGSKSCFGDYLSQFEAKQLRNELLRLFRVLDQKEDEREEYLEADLAAFPYVNGGLFTEEDSTIPQLTEEIKNLLVSQASNDFDWSEISPTIFGAIFESTLNPVTRREGGMHYTSVENIHKVIDPLFLDDLKAEFESLKKIRNKTEQVKQIKEFQKKLGSLKFLDPACGSGNFLTETYLSLRRLENECLKIRFNNKIMLDVFDDVICVNINQFYGIEINDFAVVVAKTALWIAENQMLAETANIIQKDLNPLPLKSYANIAEANALKIDWENVVAKRDLNYIIGNPPFVGAMKMTDNQHDDIRQIFPECEQPGEIDYVAGWYVKTAHYIQDSRIECALVSTNSICQGQQVALIWKPLFEKYNLEFNYAYRTFRWDSEANIKAQVHCVIIGFSCHHNHKQKIIYRQNEPCIYAKNINGYLTNLDNFFITDRTNQVSGMPLMHMGVMARGKDLIMSEIEYLDYIKKEPLGKQWIHRYMMGKELIRNIPRYCFWLVNADPSELQKCPLLLKRIEKVRQARLSSTAKDTQKLADKPHLFAQLAQPTKNFLAFPKVSSGQREYIPIDFLTPDIIVGDKIYVVEDAGLYHFGVLTSSIHNAWMRCVAGRWKSDYSYSNTIVYNNFPWCNPTEEQKIKIERTAQGILDARNKYENSSLLAMYGEKMFLYQDLVDAHRENDRAVMQAYGFNPKMSENDIVTELLKMYEKLVK